MPAEHTKNANKHTQISLPIWQAFLIQKFMKDEVIKNEHQLQQRSVCALAWKTVPARTNAECKGGFPGGQYNAEGGRGKCVSICISKHGILLSKMLAC